MNGSHSSVGVIEIVHDPDHGPPAAAASQFFKNHFSHMTIMPEDSGYKEESEGGFSCILQRAQKIP